MPMNCPVCQTPVNPGETECCPVCGWYLATPNEDSPLDRHRLEWAQQIWGQLQSQSEAAIASRLDRLEILEREATQERQALFAWIEWLREGLPTAAIDDTPIDSEVGIDFTLLLEYLAAQQWREADEETWRIALQVAGREGEGWLQLADIETFAATDLLTLDRAWYDYSGGCFGLGIQHSVYQQVEGSYEQFCDRVGWRSGYQWKTYDELDFHIHAPMGHFPVLGWRKRSCYGAGEWGAAETMVAWWQRWEAIGSRSN